MKDISHIIDEYRNSNFDQRLIMFLARPSLRTEFVGIEQAEAKEQSARSEHLRVVGRPIVRPLRRLLNRCCGSAI